MIFSPSISSFTWKGRQWRGAEGAITPHILADARRRAALLLAHPVLGSKLCPWELMIKKRVDNTYFWNKMIIKWYEGIIAFRSTDFWLFLIKSFSIWPCDSSYDTCHCKSTTDEKIRYIPCLLCKKCIPHLVKFIVNTWFSLLFFQR